MKDSSLISSLGVQVESTFGQRSLGMNFLYTTRGDVQAMDAPMSYDKDWMGTLLFSVFPSTMRYQERNLYLDNSQSETRTIKTTLSFGSPFSLFPSHLKFELFFFLFQLPRTISIRKI